MDLATFFRFLIYTQSAGLLGRGISPSQGRYLYTEQHKHRINAHNTNIHTLSGIRTYDPCVRAASDLAAPVNGRRISLTDNKFPAVTLSMTPNAFYLNLASSPVSFLLIPSPSGFLCVFSTYTHHVLSPAVRINGVNLERRRYLIDRPNSEGDNAIMHL
jgi:hypothetical protein